MKRFLVVACLSLAGCVDGGPGYVPTIQPMDATPFMNKPAPSAYPQSKVCPNGYIVPINYLC